MNNSNWSVEKYRTILSYKKSHLGICLKYLFLTTRMHCTLLRHKLFKSFVKGFKISSNPSNALWSFCNIQKKSFFKLRNHKASLFILKLLKIFKLLEVFWNFLIYLFSKVLDVKQSSWIFSWYEEASRNFITLSYI